MIVDRAIYRDGKRTAEPLDLSQMSVECRRDGGIAWVGLYRPTEREFAAVADEFQLHELAVEDAVKAHQRPKLERYGDTLFCVLRPARYIDASETVEFGVYGALPLRRTVTASIFGLSCEMRGCYARSSAGARHAADECVPVAGSRSAVSS